MSSKIVIPTTIMGQDFWSGKFTVGQAVIDLFLITSQQKIAVEESFFIKRWGIKDPLTSVLNTDFVKHYFKIDSVMGILSVERKTASKPKKKEDTSEIEGIAIEFLNHFNGVFDTKYRTPAGFIRNMAYWSGFYTKDDIFTAVKNARNDAFWGTKLTPVLLFRKRNPSGENVDYIGKFLNMKVKRENAFEKILKEQGY